MPAFLFLRVYEDSSNKSSSMKSVRAAAIMFVSVARCHSAKHLYKCAQLLRFSISLKFKNLHWMLVSVRLYLVHLDSACLKCFKTSARNSVEHVKKKPSLIRSFARHHTAKHLLKCAQLLRFSMSWSFKSAWMLVSERLLLVHLNVSWIWNVRLCPIYFSFNSVRKELHVSCDHYVSRALVGSCLNIRSF